MQVQTTVAADSIGEGGTAARIEVPRRGTQVTNSRGRLVRCRSK